MTGKPDYEGQFRRLIEEYANPIRRLCTAYAADDADRQDLFQDVFLAVWRALPRFRGQASVRTWMYRIAHNVALTWQTRDRRRRSRQTPLDADVAVESDLDERRLALSRAIGALASGDRALTLLWLEGLSAVEIEQITGVKAATVAVRLSRIRKRLEASECVHER